MIGKHTRMLITLGCGFASVGCTNWQAVDPAAKPVVPVANMLEFDAHGQHVRLYAPRLGPDSVSGVVRTDQTACDTCRVTYALADISHAKTAEWHQSGSAGFATFAMLSAIVGFVLWKLPGAFGNGTHN
jgi:hypothetical protein